MMPRPLIAVVLLAAVTQLALQAIGGLAFWWETDE